MVGDFDPWHSAQRLSTSALISFSQVTGSPASRVDEPAQLTPAAASPPARRALVQVRDFMEASDL
jgi:hypothetical protein